MDGWNGCWFINYCFILRRKMFEVNKWFIHHLYIFFFKKNVNFQILSNISWTVSGSQLYGPHSQCPCHAIFLERCCIVFTDQINGAQATNIADQICLSLLLSNGIHCSIFGCMVAATIVTIVATPTTMPNSTKNFHIYKISIFIRWPSSHIILIPWTLDSLLEIL